MDRLRADPGAVKWGYLTKKGGDRRNWTHRFFVLRKSPEKTLEYHKDHKVPSQEKEKDMQFLTVDAEP